MGLHEGMISGPVTIIEPRLNRTRSEMMADFKAEMKARRQLRVVDFDKPPPKDKMRPEDYPWNKPGWSW